MITILGIPLGKRCPDQEAADELRASKLALGEAKSAVEYYSAQVRMHEARIGRLSPVVAASIVAKEREKRERAAGRAGTLDRIAGILSIERLSRGA